MSLVKYKLIKEYPGSYKKGYVTIQVEPCPFYSNYPEYWQKVTKV